MPKITPSLWFDNNAVAAAEYYTSVFPNSSIEGIERYTADERSRAEHDGVGLRSGDVVYVTFVLDGQRFIGINGGPMFTFDEAVSFEVLCADQGEVDYYWEKLTDGGEESQCGWLKDRFGLSWQIVPKRLYELTEGDDPAIAAAATAAMLKMRRIVVADLEAAARDV